MAKWWAALGLSPSGEIRGGSSPSTRTIHEKERLFETSRHVPKLVWDYLDEEEKKQVEAFIAREKIGLKFLEECAAGTSPVHFELTESGIAMLVVVCYRDKRMDIMSKARIESL